MEDNFFKNLMDNLYDGVYYVDLKRRITYWNRAAESITGYNSERVVGSFCWDNILMHVNGEGGCLCQKQCPILKTISDGRHREMDSYLHHKEGHRLAVHMRVTPIRNSGDKIIGVVAIFSDNSSKLAILEKNKELKKMALFDPLTQVANRQYIEMNLNLKLKEMQRYGWPLGVVFIDIDNFKRINDVYGHYMGDQVLRMVASTLSKDMRSFDILGRWGGDEFIAIISNTEEDEVFSVAERIRTLVEQSGSIADMKELVVTISVGVTIARTDDTVESIMKRADRLMYDSKAYGRNQVMSAV